jgi:L-arabinokinase
MWRLPPSLDAVPDSAHLRDALAARADFFDPASPVWLARAPGRLDLMGGFADYSGGLVLQMPMANATFCAAQRTGDGLIRVASAEAAEENLATEVSIPAGELCEMQLDEARRFFAADQASRWAAYAAGALLVLLRDRGLGLAGTGLRMLLASNVPLSKGLSSSAAVEVAAMRAVAAALDIQIGGRELALLCQQAENHVVGAPCGVMDQMTSALGQRRRLLALRCQPAEVEGQVPIPEDVEIWAVDSGIRHAVSGADYGSVRVGTFMGYRIIADLAGLHTAEEDEPDRVRVNDPHWHGHLANLLPSEYETRFRDHLPRTMKGGEFLQRYGGTTDTVTRVEPSRIYPVRHPVEHPVYETQRVRLVRALLSRIAMDDESLGLTGELMYQAHASYTACGVGSDGTDRIVELAREAGPAWGVFGAKITGGGSGGCVAILGRRDAAAAVQRIARCYREESGMGGAVYLGTSDGAMAFGAVALERA